MRRSHLLHLLPVALVFGLASLAAQGPGGTAAAGTEPLNGQGKTTVIMLPPGAPACPVQMLALQSTNGGLRMARDGQRGQQIEGPSQRIHLVLASGQTGRVVSAKVTVRGLSGKKRSVMTVSSSGPQPDRTQTLTVPFAAEDPASVAADLTLPGFTAVLSIRLDEITYADGTSWKVNGAQACSVAPDPLVWVAGW
ncbi:MAG TPA: hypothetical protein VE291_11145 [Terracidiphilus sp.]|jgi:hypothetical protein|nr:hypothetical protein [Terracidiphilus sp.]